ncbi:MAG: hypothetical protein L0Y66_00145 [Myxococcaceae bacterium]|nr:hypothetical protein [Myxococcaceae bacterium]
MKWTSSAAAVTILALSTACGEEAPQFRAADISPKWGDTEAVRSTQAADDFESETNDAIPDLWGEIAPASTTDPTDQATLTATEGARCLTQIEPPTDSESPSGIRVLRALVAQNSSETWWMMLDGTGGALVRASRVDPRPYHELRRYTSSSELIWAKALPFDNANVMGPIVAPSSGDAYVWPFTAEPDGLLLISGDGAREMQVPATGSELYGREAFEVDASGNLVLSHTPTLRVLRPDRSQAWSATGNLTVWDANFDTSGNVLALLYGDHVYIQRERVPLSGLALLKLSSTGALLWHLRFSPFDAFTTNTVLNVAHDGSVIVTGWFHGSIGWGDVRLDNTDFYQTNGYPVYAPFAVAVNAQGCRTWARRIPTSFKLTAALPGGGLSIVHLDGNDNLMVSIYDAHGGLSHRETLTTFDVERGERINPTSFDVDPFGNLWISGSFVGPPHFGDQFVPSPGSGGFLLQLRPR